MADIRVSPSRLREVASQLDNNRVDIDNTVNTMKSAVANLAGEWTGMAQVDYAQMFDNEVPQMQTRMNEILENLIQAMKRIADAFEQTDNDVI